MRDTTAKKFALLGLAWLRARKTSPSTPQNANFGPFFVRRANFFALSPTIRPSRANFFAHRTQPRGNCETDITTAPENCTKNVQFSPAKAMAVSDKRAAWPTGAGCGAMGSGGT